MQLFYAKLISKGHVLHAAELHNKGYMNMRHALPLLDIPHGFIDATSLQKTNDQSLVYFGLARS